MVDWLIGLLIDSTPSPTFSPLLLFSFSHFLVFPSSRLLLFTYIRDANWISAALCQRFCQLRHLVCSRRMRDPLPIILVKPPNDNSFFYKPMLRFLPTANCPLPTVLLNLISLNLVLQYSKLRFANCQLKFRIHPVSQISCY